MPINISFDSNLTQNEVDALRALLGTLQPARGGPLNREPTREDFDWEEPEVSVGEPVTIPEDQIDAVEAEIKATLTAELDSDGKEWDESIHASTRTKTADGRWKKKRGVGKVEEDAVTQVAGTPAVTVPTPYSGVPVPPPPIAAPTPYSGVPTFPDAVKICSALGKETYEKLFTELAIKSVMELKDDAARARFFEHESVILVRMEKGV